MFKIDPFLFQSSDKLKPNVLTTTRGRSNRETLVHIVHLYQLVPVTSEASYHFIQFGLLIKQYLGFTPRTTEWLF